MRQRTKYSKPAFLMGVSACNAASWTIPFLVISGWNLANARTACPPELTPNAEMGFSRGIASTRAAISSENNSGVTGRGEGSGERDPPRGSKGHNGELVCKIVHHFLIRTTIIAPIRDKHKGWALTHHFTVKIHSIRMGHKRLFFHHALLFQRLYACIVSMQTVSVHISTEC